ncbi:MAG: ATP-dependent Clp protease adaptor ClpS [Spirochaetia bacterium]|nr:ATP-dependent Clp protease adaptor ClpS [Spirochaetia bacterium]
MRESLHESGLALKDQSAVKRPSRYEVFLLNDNYTTMEFVVSILITIFNKAQDEAVKIMYDVHKNGKGAAGVFPREIAEMKVHLVHKIARQNGHPLRADMKKE